MIVTYGNTTATTAGKLYYLDAFNNWIQATNSNSVGRQLAVANGASSSVNGMITQGTITNATYYSSFSTGGALYVSATNGLMTNTAPSSNIRVLGNSLGSNQIFFSPSNILSLPTGMSGYGIASGSGALGYETGTITDPSNGFQYTLLKWKDSTSGQINFMNVSTAGLFEVFVLAGGGGSGITNVQGSGGGGGAGQLVNSTIYLEAGAYTITVGAGGSSGHHNQFGGGRGGFSAIFQATPVQNNPKISAVGGGGGMSSASSTSVSVTNSRWFSSYSSDGWCGGGNASPFNDEGTITYGTVNTTQTTNFSIGGNNTLGTGSFYGGAGQNDTNYSATGGGGGLTEQGQDRTGSGSSFVGGRGGNGIISGFSGRLMGYGGGGAGGTSADTGHQLNTSGVWASASISGTTLTITSIISGGNTIAPNQRVFAKMASGSAVRGESADVYEIYIVQQLTGTTGGAGTYQLNNTFSMSGYTSVFINLYGNGVGGRYNAPVYHGGSFGGSNSGSGGGGGANQNNNGGGGGGGGSGVVMVRYRI
jgi:hypothetical protein